MTAPAGSARTAPRLRADTDRAELRHSLRFLRGSLRALLNLDERAPITDAALIAHVQGAVTASKTGGRS